MDLRFKQHINYKYNTYAADTFYKIANNMLYY